MLTYKISELEEKVKCLYDKIIVMTLNDSENEIVNKDNSNIYDVIEKEFGRCLSPIEYETIKGWLDSNISEDLIKEALRSYFKWG